MCVCYLVPTYPLRTLTHTQFMRTILSLPCSTGATPDGWNTGTGAENDRESSGERGEWRERERERERQRERERERAVQ